jgi:oligosaccharide repeat unit polymerase
MGVSAFLVGTFIAYILNLKRELVPINVMRKLLREEEVLEERLFRFIFISVVIYSITYVTSFLIKGWLPIFTVGKMSRVEFNIYGFGIFINSVSFIMFFTILYFFLVQGNKGKKIFLAFTSSLVMGSYFLLLQRFQVIMAGVICVTFLYYISRAIRLKTALIPVLIATAFFYWIMSLRLGNLLATYTHRVSKMKFPIDYAFLTEPYMYVVMNLENLAHCVNASEFYTYGYFTFDFVAAITGLKYWILEYFNLSRTPYLISYYNTYTAFWWFYSDFGVIGLALIPWLLGFSIGSLYYKMRFRPTIKRVVAYGVMVFVMIISFFNFPITYLWFEYNLLALYLILKWTMIPKKRIA